MKNLLYTIAFIASGLVASAQVGVGNTDPKTTLDVTGVTAAGVADGVMVPRFTVAELNAKTAAYGADQNSALVFITNATGPAGITSNVTAVGFHYYNHATTKWVAVGGGGGAVLPTYRTVAGAATTTVNASDVGNVVIITGTVSGDIQLPSPTIDMIGKKLTIIMIGTGSQNLTNLNPTYFTNTYGGMQQHGAEFITDGTNWYSLGGQ